MGEEIALEKGRISDFHVLVTLTLTSDRVILYTVMHHLSKYEDMKKAIRYRKWVVQGS